MFHCLPDSAWVDGNLVEVARQRGKMVEHPNQSQPNQGLRADGTPCIKDTACMMDTFISQLTRSIGTNDNIEPRSWSHLGVTARHEVDHADTDDSSTWYLIEKIELHDMRSYIFQEQMWTCNKIINLRKL